MKRVFFSSSVTNSFKGCFEICWWKETNKSKYDRWRSRMEYCNHILTFFIRFFFYRCSIWMHQKWLHKIYHYLKILSKIYFLISSFQKLIIQKYDSFSYIDSNFILIELVNRNYWIRNDQSSFRNHSNINRKSSSIIRNSQFSSFSYACWKDSIRKNNYMEII